MSNDLSIDELHPHCYAQPMKRLRLGTGVAMAVCEHGQGEAVLPLHAWGETRRTFDRLIASDRAGSARSGSE
ncbi:hypothetical protein GCM10027417_09890 [Glutamicibacter endophyticus]